VNIYYKQTSQPNQLYGWGLSMELKNEKREELKEVLRQWLPNRVWIEDEIYPFGDLGPISTEFAEIVLPFGIEFKGIKTFGETLTFESVWVSEGLWFETNVNPTIQRDGFRVVFRWKGLPEDYV
jgi:hypothetical protein